MSDEHDELKTREEIIARMQALRDVYTLAARAIEERGLPGWSVFELAGLMASSMAQLNGRPVDEALEEVARYARWFFTHTQVSQTKGAQA